MSNFEHLTQRLREGHNLSHREVAAAVELLAAAEDSPETKAEFLAALTSKGETTKEIAAFANELRERAIAVPIDAETRARTILDVCGTGGDRLNTFNISTAVALVCAAAGITVAKHGNRAITSLAGSAEVLEALGVPIDLTPAEAAESLRLHNFAFFFAPKYHPAFQHIGPARKLCAERGTRTIFNIMGPLLNPARPNVQLVGVPRPQFCQPVAVVLENLGARQAMVVCGQAGDAFLDELSTIGPSTTASFEPGIEPHSGTLSPTDVAIPFARLEDLRGGDKFANAEIIRSILDGRERGPKRDAVVLNAGAAFVVAGRAGSVAEGVRAAADAIDSGGARAKLDQLTRKK
jgi:anthranilate phosphoribosyltransferase